MTQARAIFVALRRFCAESFVPLSPRCWNPPLEPSELHGQNQPTGGVEKLPLLFTCSLIHSRSTCLSEHLLCVSIALQAHNVEVGADTMSVDAQGIFWEA